VSASSVSEVKRREEKRRHPVSLEHQASRIRKRERGEKREGKKREKNKLEWEHSFPKES